MTPADRRWREMPIPEAADFSAEDRWYAVLMQGSLGRQRKIGSSIATPKPFEVPRGCGCTQCGCLRPWNPSLAVGAPCHCELATESEPTLDDLARCNDCFALLPPPKNRGRKPSGLCKACLKLERQANYRERRRINVAGLQTHEIIRV
jgi:hypothetical protein